MMRRSAFFALLALVSTQAAAASIDEYDKLCLSQKHNHYVTASINWYESLVEMTTKKDPKLEEVANWFLTGRKEHFELNREAFDYYLENDPSKLNLSAPVESWLNLSQEDVKALSNSDSELAVTAKKVFEFRQAQAHQGNYDLRSALASLLSHPKEIEVPLQRYNTEMTQLADTSCLK